MSSWTALWVMVRLILSPSARADVVAPTPIQTQTPFPTMTPFATTTPLPTFTPLPMPTRSNIFW